MSRKCSTHGRDEYCMQRDRVRNKRAFFRHLGLNERAVLEYVFWRRMLINRLDSVGSGYSVGECL